ncbi:glycosyltransferase family 2 protein [Burkholderia ubonensis]|uniref:glycosyltransferase family 2 protein n=1 Tax=Burkholderia ubonensis TaxID=101571 RepID=UPI0009B36AA2|nr:glycosyltransferase family 2 protein [Burkholderia ubonensis]
MSLRSDAIVVTYEPDVSALSNLVATLTRQVGRIVIIDNGSANLNDWRHVLPASNFHVIDQGINAGIAAALNTGLRTVREFGTAEFAVLFDQDSAPSDAMVDQLEQYHDELTQHRQPVAQIGPYFFEQNRNHYLPFIEFAYGVPLRKHARRNVRWTTADYLITSGSLVPLSAIDRVGSLDESLFIDYVDIEWGLRAKAAGLQSYGVYEVRMHHSIGERALKLASIRVAMHKPIRRYYYYRNALLLCRRRYVPVAWKIHEVARLSVKFWIFALFSPRRSADVRMMIRGILDGLRGRSGKYDDQRAGRPH